MKKIILTFILSICGCLIVPSNIAYAANNSTGNPQNKHYENTQVASNINVIKDVEAKKTATDKVRYIDQVFKNFKLDKDIKYKEAMNDTGNKENLLLDVYSPDGDTKENRPVIIWVHGGALCYGNKDEQDWLPTIYSKAFAKKGYVTVNINYRLTQDPIQDWNGAMKNAMEDVVSAIDWVRANSKQYGMDKNKIILAGYSAGAEIVTNVAYGGYVNVPNRDSISGVIDISGNTLFWGDALKNTPPCTIIHGTADKDNEFRFSEDLLDKLKASNIKCELNPFEGADHYFGINHKNNETENSNTEKIDKIISIFLYDNVINE